MDSSGRLPAWLWRSTMANWPWTSSLLDSSGVDRLWVFTMGLRMAAEKSSRNFKNWVNTRFPAMKLSWNNLTNHWQWRFLSSKCSTLPHHLQTWEKRIRRAWEFAAPWPARCHSQRHHRVNKKITEEVATIPSKRLRNKIAGFTTHLMKRIGKGPSAGWDRPSGIPHFQTHPDVTNKNCEWPNNL